MEDFDCSYYLKSRYQKLAKIKINNSSQYAHKWLIKAYVHTNVIPLVQIKQQYLNSYWRVVSTVCSCVLTGVQFGIWTGVEPTAIFLSSAITSFEQFVLSNSGGTTACGDSVMPGFLEK